MKKLVVCLSVLLVLVAVNISIPKGHVKSNKSQVVPDFGEFQPQVSSFAAAAKEEITPVDFSGLSMGRTDLFDGTPVLAVCIPSENVILVNNESWSKASDLQKQLTIWHELGHCVLGREHSTWVHDGYPMSIMFPMLWETREETYYWEHRLELQHELFHPFMESLYVLTSQSGIDILCTGSTIALDKETTQCLTENLRRSMLPKLQPLPPLVPPKTSKTSIFVSLPNWVN